MTKHDKIIAILCALAFALLIILSIREAEAQVSNQQCTQEKDQQTTSGLSGTKTFPDSCGTRINTFEIVPSGAPATVTVTINGCMRGTTCTQLATSSVTTAQIITASGGPFDNLQVVYTLTGGVSPTLQINRTAATGMAGLGPTTAGQPVIVGAGGALLSSSATYDLSNPVWQDPGGDACKTINNALNAVVISTQLAPYMIWSTPGKFACASNPFAGSPANTFTGTLQITPGANFWVSGSTGWIQPPGSTVTGNGFAGFGELGTSGFSVIACQSLNQAGICKGAFAIDTPLYCFWSCSTVTSLVGGKDTQLWFFTLDCGYVQGCRTLQNYYTQEVSGLRFGFLQNWCNNGVGLDMGNPSGGAGSSQNSSIFGVEIQNQNGPNGATQNCTVGAVGMRFTYSSPALVGPHVISDITLAPECPTCTTVIYPNHGAEINGYVSFDGIVHTEGNGDSSIEIGTATYLGTMNCSGATCTFVSGDTFNGATGWPTGCTGIFRIGGTEAGAATKFTVSSCAVAGSVTFTASPPAGNQVYAFDFTSASIGSAPVHIQEIQNTSTGAAGTAGTNYCDTCVPTVVGITAGSGDANVDIGPIKAAVPNASLNLVRDGFNKTITRASTTLGTMTCYRTDQAMNVLCDDSGTNVILQKGGASIGGLNIVGGKFSTNGGCGESAAGILGGATGGTITTVGSTSCTTIITAKNITALHGFLCFAYDITTAADYFHPTCAVSNTTTLTVVTGTIVAGDVIGVVLFGY